jgi:hypothetical protein
MSSLNYLYQKNAEALYPFNEAKTNVKAMLAARACYLEKVKECYRAPAYKIMLPTGTHLPCLCEPLLNDKTNLVNQEYLDGSLGSWQKVTYRRVRQAKNQESSFEDYDE